MTYEELEKKAELYIKRNDIEMKVINLRFRSVKEIYKAYLTGAKEMQKENDQLKEKIKNVREKLFNFLSEYEIGNYDNNIHQFYKDVYAIHNELMELAE